MKHENKDTFKSTAPVRQALSMMDAIGEAKKTVMQMTGLPTDSVANCQREEGGTWQVSIDVIESPARMGDNDLLATYSVTIGPGPELQAFARSRRYHREDEGI